MNEEIPFNVMVGMLLEKSNVVDAVKATDNLRPTSQQYAMGPGDLAIMAGSHSQIDGDLTLLKILDPEEYKDRFPDYENRLVNSYVLCEWIEVSDGSRRNLGWFSRVKLIKITEEQYQTVLDWFENEIPNEMPTWLQERFMEYTTELNAISPDAVPKMITCGNCQSPKVLIQITQHIDLHCPAGELLKDGETKIVPMGSVHSNSELKVRLFCTECNSYRDVEEGELICDSDSPFAQVLKRHLESDA